jgi:hypothetical protein
MSGGLLVDGDHDAAGRGVEAPLRVRVADLRDLLADDAGDVDVRLGRDLAGHDDEARRDQRLAGDAPRRVVRENGVEHGVRDLVGDLVGVPFGDRLGREEEFARGHVPRERYLIVRNPDTVVRLPSCFEYRSADWSGLTFARTSRRDGLGRVRLGHAPGETEDPGQSLP